MQDEINEYSCANCDFFKLTDHLSDMGYCILDADTSSQVNSNYNCEDFVEKDHSTDSSNIIFCGIRECNGWSWGQCQKQPATTCMRKTNRVI